MATLPDDLYLLQQINFSWGAKLFCVMKITKISTPQKLPAIQYGITVESYYYAPPAFLAQVPA